MAITRRTLIGRIDRFIRSIENRKIEPDHWEGYCTKLALAGDGHLERAEAKMMLARTPTDLRVSRDRPRRSAG